MFDTRQLEGREHYVVPVVMITVGTFRGSGGLVHYTSEPLQNSVRYWDGKPVVVYHPGMYSQGFAGSPDVFNQQKVGVLFNTRFDGSRLLADAWIDVLRVTELDVRVRNTVINGQMMEVSTGLVVDGAETQMTVNGEQQTVVVARHLIPDHLAILPDQRGACSIADGAGLCRNELVISPHFSLDRNGVCLM